MAIKLGTEVQTSKGAVAELYFHVTEFYRNKDGKVSSFPVKYYTDETKEVECKIFEGDLENVFKFDISETIGEKSIEKAAYDSIGSKLKEAGLSPSSDESGSWQLY